MDTITDQVPGSTEHRKPEEGVPPKDQPDTGSKPDSRNPRSDEQLPKEPIPDMDPPGQGDDSREPKNQPDGHP